MNDEEFEFNPAEFNDIHKDQFPKYYNLEKVMETQIKPLLTSIINICSEHEIPMLATFQYQKSPKKIMFSTSAVNPPKRTDTRLVNAIDKFMTS